MDLMEKIFGKRHDETERNKAECKKIHRIM
jgi:hypothetical protein